MSWLKIAAGSTLLAALGACGAERASQPSPEPPPRAATAPRPPEAPTPVAPPGDAGAPAEVGPPEARLLSFQRVLDAPAHSVAFGEKSHVAALGAEAWIDRGAGFVRLPGPPKPTEHVRIYFGRDNQPRLMGFERTPSGEASVYYRFRKGGWERGTSEIGRLGGAEGALYGVLGFADPEVVCKPGEACIIKRLTGWTTLPPLPGLPEVTLSGAQAWAFEKGELWSLEKNGWQPVGGAPPRSDIRAVWGTSTAEVWVVDGQVIHHLSRGTWSSEPSPIAEPPSIWAASPSDVWLAGKGGAARHDGKTWTRAAGAPRDVRVVTGRGAADVWLAGASGVYRGTR